MDGHMTRMYDEWKNIKVNIRQKIGGVPSEGETNEMMVEVELQLSKRRRTVEESVAENWSNWSAQEVILSFFLEPIITIVVIYGG